MTNRKLAQEIYSALEAKKFDMDADGFRAVIEAVLDKCLKRQPKEAAAPLLLEALLEVQAAATVYDSDDRLTPLQIEIRNAAKEEGLLPSQYVMKRVRGAIAAAKGEVTG